MRKLLLRGRTWLARRAMLLRDLDCDPDYVRTGLSLFLPRLRECFPPWPVTALVLRTSDSIRAISSLTELTRSKFQIASLTRFCAPLDRTPSASAENFSSIS